LACGTPEVEIKETLSFPIDTTDALVLHTDWRYNTNYSGVFTDHASGKEYFFLGDIRTHLRVRVFNIEGQHLFDVPLDSAINAVNDIHCLTMLTKDRLVLLDDRGEHMVVLDTTGRIVRKRSLVDVRCDEHDDLYELYPTNTGLTLLDGKLYLGPALMGACNDKPYYERTNSELLTMQRYYALATGKCKVAEIDPLATSAGVRFGASSLLEHLTDVPRKTLGTAYTAQANGKVFVFSNYSPFVHEIDTATLTVSRKVPINYMYGDVGITPPPISEEGLKRDSANILRAIKPYVLSFTYDQPSGHYLAAVVHELPDDTPKEDPAWWRNWSLVVLDSNYNKVGEYVLSGKVYSGSVLLSTKQGTWVLKKDLDAQAFMKPKVFHKLRLP
jgi:hypothetical protein